MQEIIPSDNGNTFIGKLNENFGAASSAANYSIVLQGGKLRNDGSVVGSLAVGSDDFYKYMHTPLFIEFDGSLDEITDVTLQTGESLLINCYNGTMSYISQVSSLSSIPATTRFIKMMVTKSTAYSGGRILAFSAKLTKGLRQVKNGVGGSVSTKFVSFEAFAAPITDESVKTSSYNGISGRHFDNGFIILPPNYSPEGEPVKLVIFVHGSGGYDFTESSVKLYGSYLEFIAKNGYMVADCSGQSDYLANNSDNCPDCKCAPTAYACFCSLYDFIVKNYNVATDGCYIFGKSAGGMMTCQLAYNQPFPIRATGNLAPAISLFGSDLRCADANKCDYAVRQLGFPNPNLGLMIQDSTSQQYILTNIANAKGWEPFFTGTDIDLHDTVEAMFSQTYLNYANNTAFHAIVDEASRSLNCPHKIWHAVDDDTVDIDVNRAFVGMAKRGGCIALLREMPANTGKHHSVDNATNAPKTNYTTRYGGVVNIPVAYAELVDWFNRW